MTPEPRPHAASDRDPDPSAAALDALNAHWDALVLGAPTEPGAAPALDPALAATVARVHAQAVPVAASPPTNAPGPDSLPARRAPAPRAVRADARAPRFTPLGSWWPVAEYVAAAALIAALVGGTLATRNGGPGGVLASTTAQAREAAPTGTGTGIAAPATPAPETATTTPAAASLLISTDASGRRHVRLAPNSLADLPGGPVFDAGEPVTGGAFSADGSTPP